MFGFGKKEESYTSIIKSGLKEGIKKFIEIEGNGEGIINLIFGILIFLLIILICVPITFAYIIKFIYPNCDIIMPWYGALSFFIAGLIYFYYCAMKVGGIMSKRKIINSKIKK